MQLRLFASIYVSISVQIPTAPTYTTQALLQL